MNSFELSYSSLCWARQERGGEDTLSFASLTLLTESELHRNHKPWVVGCPLPAEFWQPMYCTWWRKSDLTHSEKGTTSCSMKIFAWWRAPKRNCGHWVNPQPTRSDNYANNFTDASPACAKNYSCTYQRPLVSLLGHLHLPNHLFTLPLQLSNAWQFRRQKLSKEPRQWQIQNPVFEKNINP